MQFILIIFAAEYSRMRWIQVMVFQSSDLIELYVDDEICQIPGKRILSNNFIKKFEITDHMDGNLFCFLIKEA